MTDGLVLWHPTYNRNVGRITEVHPDFVRVSVNAGRGGPVVDLPLSACRGFDPAAGDRVIRCVYEDDGSDVLIRLPKRKA